jgi:hypothetical protein
MTKREFVALNVSIYYLTASKAAWYRGTKRLGLLEEERRKGKRDRRS